MNALFNLIIGHNLELFFMNLYANLSMTPDYGEPAQANFWENSNENFLYIQFKQLLSYLLAVKFHTHSFFFLGNMDQIM